MPLHQIQAIAICVFFNAGKILVNKAFDSVKQEIFYRPLGGKINFGESSIQAVIREIREEINAEISNINYLGTIENIFMFEGQQGHQIVQVYNAEFIDSTFYTKPYITGAESNGTALNTKWCRLDEFNNQSPLYPAGLTKLLYVKLHPSR